MKILRRYLLRQHLVPFVFALSALTSFELLRQIAKRLGDLLGKGLPWTVIVEFFALTIPFLVAITLSMSVLVAVLFTVSRMAGDHELTAMRAGGVSIGTFMRPLLLAGTGVALVSFLFGDQILPRANHRLRNLMSSIYRTKPTFSLKEHIINEVKRGKISLRAAQIDQATYRMRDVTIYSLEQSRRKRVIYGDSGYVAFAPNREDLALTLYDGMIHDYDSEDPQVFQQTAFERQIVLVKGVTSEFVRQEQSFRGEREMGICELEENRHEALRELGFNRRKADLTERNGLRSLVGLPPLEEDTITVVPEGPGLYCRTLAFLKGVFTPEELEAQERVRPISPRTRPDALPRGPPAEVRSTQQVVTPPRPRPVRVSEIRVFRDREHSSRVRAATLAVELQKKLAIPAACIVFVLVGVPLALRFPRGGLGLVLGAGMIVFAIYYVGLIAGESLADRLTLSPFLAMWGTNILMGGLGVIGLVLERRAGTVPRRVAWRRRRLGAAS
jgi:lipopolysaccharide export system permease protein